MDHPFFADMDWKQLLKKQVTPPFKPQVESETDTSNFDPVFTSSLPIDSVPKNSMPLSETVQQNFKGFTYTEENLDSSLASMKLGNSLRRNG